MLRECEENDLKSIIVLLDKIEERFGKWSVDVILALIWCVLVLVTIQTMLLVLMMFHPNLQQEGEVYFYQLIGRLLISLISCAIVFMLSALWMDRRMARKFKEARERAETETKRWSETEERVRKGVELWKSIRASAEETVQKGIVILDDAVQTLERIVKIRDEVQDQRITDDAARLRKRLKSLE